MSLKEQRSSIKANAELLEALVILLTDGPPTKFDMADLQSIRKDCLAKLYTPCSHFLEAYDVNTCGVCSGSRCCDWEVKYDSVTGLPHVYKYIDEDDWEPEGYNNM
jgi:hypothetical protein